MSGSFLRELAWKYVLYFANEKHSGVPHSLQALDGGVEFLLVFDDGSFSEDSTFLATELFARNPVCVPSPMPTLEEPNAS